MFEGGDTNLYGYVANDPVNWIDPRGTDKIDDFLNRSKKRRDDALDEIEKEKNPFKNAKTIYECGKDDIDDAFDTLTDIIKNGSD